MIISGKLFRITPHLHLALAWKPNKYVRDYPQSLCASLHTVTGAHTWMKSPCVRRKPSRSFSGQIRGRGSRAPRFCRYFLDNVLLCYLQVCWPVCSEHGLTILHKNDAKILQVHTQKIKNKKCRKCKKLQPCDSMRICVCCLFQKGKYWRSQAPAWKKQGIHTFCFESKCVHTSVV